MMDFIPVVCVECYRLLYYGPCVHLHDYMNNLVKYVVVCGVCCG
jgi:hypothetical protein